MILGVLLATVASFAASAVLYAVPPIGGLIARASTARPGVTAPIQVVSVVLRSLVTAVLVAGLMAAAGWHGAGAGLALGLALTVLPAVLLSGAVVHESTPILVALVHLLDWLVKLAITGLLVGFFF